MNWYNTIGLIAMALTLVSGAFQNSELVLACGITALYCAIRSVGFRIKIEESDY